MIKTKNKIIFLKIKVFKIKIDIIILFDGQNWLRPVTL